MFHFSYVQEIYDEVREAKRYYLAWRNEEKIWNYNNCVVTVIGMNDNRARVVVRRKKSGHSKFMQSDFEVNLMMGIVVLNVRKYFNGNRIILAFDVEQSEDNIHRDLKEVKIWSDQEHETDDLYNEILQKINNKQDTGIIESDYVERNNSFMPVIYQPRVDAWKNFLREIHIHNGNDGSYQITLVFQDEMLRRHGILDGIYRYIRLLKYGRIVDIETFAFKDDQFFFKDIYSGKSNLFEDSIHNQELISAKYYFQDKNHPVIFVNTSNHALAPHDNNHDLWKWEYVPWSNKVPVKMGAKTRQEIDQSYQKKWIPY
ncbi:MAG: hypothetical protein KC483_07940 [Nitrosarchaeum sp.]|nr:hypothetical protein [Nitrosarchaeum sp.]MCA9819969.1 hypothetical protein [Nitrosarchaeum sp.]